MSEENSEKGGPAMRFKRMLLLSLGAALVVLALAAAPSSAVKPRADCPPPFEKLTFEEALVLAHETGVPLSDEELLALFAIDDKNGDENLCFASLPDTPKRTNAVDIVDNTASVPH
jgi:hypothetical protein